MAGGGHVVVLAGAYAQHTHCPPPPGRRAVCSRAATTSFNDRRACCMVRVQAATRGLCLGPR
ncbi:hypothetical protein PR001_g10073 [Phytophthora rubi]|uniref:Uncharacterized protein n=1 Tax=Phytophthora rubi TaxID=129364 RepID=A0A6A3MLE2_9STRA|nr:hypothetical protein PR001_g10073 [Phytophthora rubi]